MTGGSRTLLAAALLLGACIPRGPAPVAPVPAPPPSPSPQLLLATDFDRVTDEKPAWEMRPVTALPMVAGDGRRYHRVTNGDTGIGIARAYGIPWSRVIEANMLTEPFVLKSGQRLFLPDGPVDRVEARARAFRLDIDTILTGGEPASAKPRAVTAVASTPATFAWPVPGAVSARFGPAGSGRVNQGIDIAAPSAAPIRAAADGTVAFVGDGVPGYGGLILLRHPGGFITAYGFAAKASVKRDQAVKRGDAIGQVSAEANPALHFEIRKNRTPVDPLKYLPKR